MDQKCLGICSSKTSEDQMFLKKERDQITNFLNGLCISKTAFFSQYIFGALINNPSSAEKNTD